MSSAADWVTAIRFEKPTWLALKLVVVFFFFLTFTDSVSLSIFLLIF